MPTGRQVSPTSCRGLVAGRGFLLWWEGIVWDTPTHNIMGSILTYLAEDPTSANTPNVPVTLLVSQVVSPSPYWVPQQGKACDHLPLSRRHLNRSWKNYGRIFTVNSKWQGKGHLVGK